MRAKQNYRNCGENQFGPDSEDYLDPARLLISIINNLHGYIFTVKIQKIEV